MSTNNSAVYGLPAPLDDDQALLGALRTRQLRDKLEQELTFPHAAATAVAAQSIPNAAYTQLAWASKVADREGAMNLATGQYTVPRAGFYLVSGSCLFAANAAGLRYLAIFLNGGQRNTNFLAANSAGGCMATVVAGLSLAAGTVVDLRAYQNSGAALSTTSAPTPGDFTVAMLGR